MIRMVVSDLDGTLRRADGSFSAADREALERLGRDGVPRILATGRTLFSVREAVPRDFPIDYLVFSSGAGILQWQTQSLLLAHHLDSRAIEEVSRTLLARGADFMLHHPIPENHRFYFRDSGRANRDFLRRCGRHPAHAEAWREPVRLKTACQFLVIEPSQLATAAYRELVEALPGYHVIRATSPFDGCSIWVEIFSRAVAKSLACRWIAEKLGVPREAVTAVGNDYNDLDLLEWAGRPFIVANAPPELRARFPVVPSHEESGFATAIGIVRASP